MSFAVKSIFYTMQGEGAHAGRPAVFCRFTGCNLWSGREEGRARAICQFCDTEFLGVDGPGGGHFPDAESLAEAIAALWPAEAAHARPYVVCTGGEPLLQLTTALVEALHARGFEVAVETNGTRPVPGGVDWVCVSPKANAKLVLRRGNELKLVYPQTALRPEDVAHLDFDRFYLQPMDGPDQDANLRAAMRYCLEHPQWSLSLQLHKVVGLP
ncbi:MAG: 7-carboxy-7-deazaguanine synthase [Sumerlaeia bacterium]